MVEYDAQRPLLRLFFGLLEATFFVGYQHGYGARRPPPARYCSGGWTEGFEFLAYLGALAILIEMTLWIVWRIVHRKEILSSDEEQQLFGSTARLGLHNRGLQSRGVQELLVRSPEIVAGTSSQASADPNSYNLVESGGRLPFAPRNPLLASVFGLSIIILILSVRGPDSIDSCLRSTFSWPDLFGRLILAYAFLAFGSFAEFRIAAKNTS